MKRAYLIIIVPGLFCYLALQNSPASTLPGEYPGFLFHTNIYPGQEELSFSVSPNPVHLGQTITVTFTEFNDRPNFTLRVMDVIGNKIYKKEYLPDTSIELSVTKEKYRPGIYILEVEQGNNVVRKRINVID